MRSRSVPNHMPQHHTKHLRNRPHIPIHLRNLLYPPSPIPTITTPTTRQTTTLSPLPQPGNITTQHLQHTRIDPIELPAPFSHRHRHRTHPRQRRPALHRLTNQVPRMQPKNLRDVPHMPSRRSSLSRIAERTTPMLPQRHRQRLPLPIHRKPDLFDCVRKPTGPTNAAAARPRSRSRSPRRC